MWEAEAGLSFRPALATKQVTGKLVLQNKILSQREKTGGARAGGAVMFPERKVGTPKQKWGHCLRWPSLGGLS